MQLTAKSRLIVYQRSFTLQPHRYSSSDPRPFKPSTNPIPLDQAIAVSISVHRLGIYAFLDSIAHHGRRGRKRAGPVRYTSLDTRLALLTTQTDISVAHGETWVRFPDMRRIWRLDTRVEPH
jgi:hypothetical protein